MKDKGEQQSLPECLFGTQAQQASKPQHRGQVPLMDNAQSLAISPSQVISTASCVNIIHISQSQFQQFPNYKVRQANLELESLQVGSCFPRVGVWSLQGQVSLKTVGP